MAAVAPAVDLRRVRVSVERHADRAIADGMQPHLQAGTVVSGHRAVQVLLRDERRAVAAADVRLEHERGLRVDRPVDHALGEAVGEQLAARRIAQPDETSQPLRRDVRLERQRCAIVDGQAALRERAFHGRALVVGEADVGGVGERREAERRRRCEFLEQELVGVARAESRQQSAHQSCGAFLEQPRRGPVRIPLDAAVCGVGGCRA